MKPLLAALLLAGNCFAADTCVILKRVAGSHVWSGIEFQYVEGKYPQGFDFVMNLRDRQARKVQKLGGRMVILEDGYALPDLESARKQCAAPAATDAKPEKAAQ
jgi:hypothetical protein